MKKRAGIGMLFVFLVGCGPGGTDVEVTDTICELTKLTTALTDAVVVLKKRVVYLEDRRRERDVLENQKACAYIANYVQTEWVPEEDTCIVHATEEVKVFKGFFTQEVAAALKMRENNKRRDK